MGCKYYCDRCGKDGDFTREDKKAIGIGDKYSPIPLVKIGLLTFDTYGPSIRECKELCKTCYEEYIVWVKK